MKKWIIRIVGGLVALLIIVLLVVFLSLNVIVKKGVETVGPQLTKVTVTLGSADISPLSGGCQLKDLFVGNPDGYKTPSAIKLGSVKVAVDIGSVMSDTITINEINIQSPEITFEGGFGGNNLSTILNNVKGSGTDNGEASASGTKPTAANGGKKFIVKDIVIEGAELHASLTGLGGKELTLPLPTLHLQNIGSQGNGVTASQLVDQILTPLLSSVTDAVKNGVTGLAGGAEGLGKNAGSAVQGVTKGLKGLFGQ
jgi:hypothetical protein